MIEVLDPTRIEALLEAGSVGRVGCHADGRTYVVPIAYAYADGCVYGHSTEGLKIRMMRQNPSVCFEVDSVESVFHWSSVIAWGTYEELHGEAADAAMRTILVRFLQARANATIRTLTQMRPGVSETGAVVYRIRLVEKTGRFERSR